MLELTSYPYPFLRPVPNVVLGHCTQHSTPKSSVAAPHSRARAAGAIVLIRDKRLSSRGQMMRTESQNAIHKQFESVICPRAKHPRAIAYHTITRFVLDRSAQVPNAASFPDRLAIAKANGESVTENDVRKSKTCFQSGWSLSSFHAFPAPVERATAAPIVQSGAPH
jgi:hypothetical protein